MNELNTSYGKYAFEYLETDRLEIVPLPPKQLKLLIDDLQSLEKEFACSYKAEPIEGIFRDIVLGQLDVTEKDPENYLWYSFWLFIRKSDRIVVGSADFKDRPDADGTVEIGYGLGKEHEHRGYMTEAVKAMCRWALEKGKVTQIIAETENRQSRMYIHKYQRTKYEEIKGAVLRFLYYYCNIL